ncbi:hypothetical protein BHM03_00027208, partial [Ensete ventricosum]
WSISGGISRGRKMKREKKRENLESALLSRSLRSCDPSPHGIRRPRDSSLAGDFFSPRGEKE